MTFSYGICVGLIAIATQPIALAHAEPKPAQAVTVSLDDGALGLSGGKGYFAPRQRQIAAVHSDAIHAPRPKRQLTSRDRSDALMSDPVMRWRAKLPEHLRAGVAIRTQKPGRLWVIHDQDGREATDQRWALTFIWQLNNWPLNKETLSKRGRE